MKLLLRDSFPCLQKHLFVPGPRVIPLAGHASYETTNNNNRAHCAFFPFAAGSTYGCLMVRHQMSR